MDVHITWQGVILVASVLAAVTAICASVAKIVHWFDERKTVKKDLAALRAKHEADMRDSMEERQLLVEGVLACLKGLAEQGCDGPVTKAIEKLERHLNQKAHE